MTPPFRSLSVEIVRQLQKAGFQAFWVGGCVRDILLGREPGDYDIATSAAPEEIERVFPGQTVPVGRQFGVLLVVRDGTPFQVATFRSDGEYRDGRRPESVSYGSAEADARRRDFTVNGLFCDPVRDRLFDWVGGAADLKARVIRTIGDPDERFAEDHLRVLRAVRFAAQLDFAIAPETWAAVQRRAGTIEGVSEERLRDELLKIFRPPHASRGLHLLRESGLLEHVLPELAATIDCEQSPQHHPEGSVYNHIALMLSLLPEGCDPALPWAVLMHDIAKPDTFSRDPKTGLIHFYGHEKIGAEKAEAILRRLKFSRKQIEEVAECVLHHMQFKDVPRMKKSTLRRMALRPAFPLELELHRLDCLGSHRKLDNYELARREFERLGETPALLPPLVTGADLIALGMRPGPLLGALLREIRDKQLQEELASREDALAWAAQRKNEADAG